MFRRQPPISVSGDRPREIHDLFSIVGSEQWKGFTKRPRGQMRDIEYLMRVKWKIGTIIARTSPSWVRRLNASGVQDRFLALQIELNDVRKASRPLPMGISSIVRA